MTSCGNGSGNSRIWHESSKRGWRDCGISREHRVLDSFWRKRTFFVLPNICSGSTVFPASNHCWFGKKIDIPVLYLACWSSYRPIPNLPRFSFHRWWDELRDQSHLDAVKENHESEGKAGKPWGNIPVLYNTFKTTTKQWTKSEKIDGILFLSCFRWFQRTSLCLSIRVAQFCRRWVWI